MLIQKCYLLSLVSEKINNKFLHDKIALGLDRTSHRIIKTWEHLACTEEIYAPLEVRLKCKINRENSCTLMLFDVVTAEMEEKTLKDMIDALTSIRRNDVKKIITDVYSGMLLILFIYLFIYLFSFATQRNNKKMGEKKEREKKEIYLRIH